ncbi:hypothetical protein J6590_036777 [Homalodisca vitripennis]|nr:hypothetical protein J6590_036777 [Homalodisca vitripennis]
MLQFLLLQATGVSKGFGDIDHGVLTSRNLTKSDGTGIIESDLITLQSDYKTRFGYEKGVCQNGTTHWTMEQQDNRKIVCLGLLDSIETGRHFFSH